MKIEDVRAISHGYYLIDGFATYHTNRNTLSMYVRNWRLYGLWRPY